MSVVQKGRELWVSPELGTNGVACAQCHPNAANTHPETYPKFQQQLGRVIALRDMINWCIMNPLEGETAGARRPADGRHRGLRHLRAAGRGAGARQALRQIPRAGARPARSGYEGASEPGPRARRSGPHRACAPRLQHPRALRRPPATRSRAAEPGSRSPREGPGCRPRSRRGRTAFGVCALGRPAALADPCDQRRGGRVGHRDQHQGDQGRGQQAADHHPGQGRLDLDAGARARAPAGAARARWWRWSSGSAAGAAGRPRPPPRRAHPVLAPQQVDRVHQHDGVVDHDARSASPAPSRSGC